MERVFGVRERERKGLRATAKGAAMLIYTPADYWFIHFIVGNW